ncbi:MAG: hypothetical protein NC908_04480, partial [Candidatus Omnitrophica bacterium]|nr:hypothetical protein [Candidatus Omnitrophota bacterium]
MDCEKLGFLSIDREDYQEAINIFKRALVKKKTSKLLLGLGIANYKLEDYETARWAFCKALEFEPDNKDAINYIYIIDSQKKQIPFSQKKSIFRANKDYLEIQDGKWKKIFIKGINIGLGLPGYFPGEYPIKKGTYLKWFEQITKLGANAIRIYTIHPPSFYEALYQFNNELGRKLYRFQGIWAELPKDNDFYNADYITDVKVNIKYAVDVVFGNAYLSEKPGSPYGRYEYDVSAYTVAFIFGREWEPYEVIAFNSKYNEKEFKGKSLSINNGTAFEVWLTEMLDYLITYESERYNSQRPVTFMNWPTLDPIYHLSEASFVEEIELRRRLGEEISLSDFKFSGIFDDDAVSIDENKIIINPSFQGGLFASYHVYPYYPDFLRNEPDYENPVFPEAIRYFNYLKDLNSHYKDIPLLISELWLSTRRGITRFH